MRLANQEGCYRLDLWFSSGLGEVNFQLGKRRAGAQAPCNSLMAVDKACFMEEDQMVKAVCECNNFQTHLCWSYSLLFYHLYSFSPCPYLICSNASSQGWFVF